MDQESDIKSIGNSTTPSFDISNELDVRRIIYLLSDSVALRLRKHQMHCAMVALWVRDTALCSYERQMKLPAPTDLSQAISAAALGLLHENWDGKKPLRSLGVRGCELIGVSCAFQLNAFCANQEKSRQHIFERTLDGIREHFGHDALQRGVIISRSKALQNPGQVNIAAANLSAIHG